MRARVRRLTTAAAAVAVSIALPLAPAACSHHDDARADGGACVFGDPSKPMELELSAIGAANALSKIDEGSDVPILFPPQGGRVVFVGVRATNFEGCNVQLSGALRDPSTQQVRIDARTIVMHATGDGHAVNDPVQGAPDISSFSNIPVCPNQWASTNVFDKEFELSVTIKDAKGKLGTKTIHVTPRCAEPDKLAECLCICKLGYVLGESCDADGGANDGGDGG
jgi:hypothetical protein